jgi:hypothetical protein
VLTPTRDLNCNPGLPLQRNLYHNKAGNDDKKHFQNGNNGIAESSGKKENERKTFLQAHQPDIPQRCIIDQNEMKRAVWLQSDEFLRRHGRLRMHGMSVDELQSQHILPLRDYQRSADTSDVKMENRNIMLSEPSMVSGITSASNTTVVRKNTKTKTTNEMRNMNRSNGPFVASDRLSIPNHITGKALERNQCMSVLRLKMKANIAWFYTQRYLKMFPSEQKPIFGTIPRKEGEIPELTCESSDSSFASSCSSISDDSYRIDRASMPSVSPVRCGVTNESFLDLAITGCLGLVPREQDHKALRSSRRQLRDNHKDSPDHCIVLINKRSGSPLAVCVLEATSGAPVVRIYATRQMAFAQKATSTTQQLGLDWADDLPLFEWAEVKTAGDFQDKMIFDIFMVKRFDGWFSSQPSYKATYDRKAIYCNSAVRSPVIKMMGRTDSERHMSGCALIWIQTDEMLTRNPSKNGSNLSFRINLAQGIDPALLICFTAIADEILEKAMRMRCQNQSKGRVPTDSFSLTKKRLLDARSREMAADPCKSKICTYTQCNF